MIQQMIKTINNISACFSWSWIHLLITLLWCNSWNCTSNQKWNWTLILFHLAGGMTALPTHFSAYINKCRTTVIAIYFKQFGGQWQTAWYSFYKMYPTSTIRLRGCGATLCEPSLNLKLVCFTFKYSKYFITAQSLGNLSHAAQMFTMLEGKLNHVCCLLWIVHWA